MTRTETLRRVEENGIIAVIRVDGPDQALDVCKALRDGGILACEIAMTTPGALRAIERANDILGDSVFVGVGTVLDAPTAVAAVHAGARFIFSPIVDHGVIEAAHRYDLAVFPGALTPTEIATAWTAGADMVKVFPANHFGPSYFRDLHGPLPQVKLTPTGGVTLDTVDVWLQAGASALGVGSALVKKEWVRAGQWTEMTSLARQFVDAVRASRASRESAE